MNSMIRHVQFVRAKAEDKEASNNQAQNESFQDGYQEVVGKEVREFYESVIASTPQPIRPKEEKQNGHASSSTKRKQISFCSSDQLSSKPNESSQTALPVCGRAIKASLTNNSCRTHELLRHCQEGNLQEVKRILGRRQGSLGDTDHYGWNALMCAAYSGHMVLVKYILRREPTMFHHETKRGETVIDLARSAGNEPMLNLLQQFEKDASILKRRKIAGSLSLKQPAWCAECEAEFADEQKVHQRSTVHLFSCRHAPAPTLYHIPESNRGFQMMLQDGWDKEKGLGKLGEGHKFPVKTTLKRDRQGLGGQDADTRPRITHFKPFDTDAVKKHRSGRDQKKEKPPVDSKSKSRSKSSSRRRHKEMEIDFRMSFHANP